MEFLSCLVPCLISFFPPEMCHQSSHPYSWSLNLPIYFLSVKKLCLAGVCILGPIKTHSVEEASMFCLLAAALAILANVVATEKALLSTARVDRGGVSLSRRHLDYCLVFDF